MNTTNGSLKIANRVFSSRLILGTGKYGSNEIMKKAVAASGCEIVTVSVRRADISNPARDIMSALDGKSLLILPNTSGAQNADEAVRLARLARATGVSDWIKIEVTPDPGWLLPDGEETLKAAKVLVKEGFTVLPYINADPILAKKLEDAGAAAVMPLASPIGSNRGMRTLDLIKIIVGQSRVPVIVDAGLGRPSHAAQALEIGVDAVMVNTAVSSSGDPEMMARGFRLAVEAGRAAYLSGLGPESDKAGASSPAEWIIK
ncbi:MAG: thiazole synthase [Endomicrobiia bacterium]|nr:thiazole synthase [Endomicrobiia bacterium]